MTPPYPHSFFCLSLIAILFFATLGIPAAAVYAQSFQEQMTDGVGTSSSGLGPNDTNTKNNEFENQKAVILTFDDDWPGQFWYVKPTLEKYDANATFFISCMAMGSIIREEQPQFMMSWDQINALYNSSFDIEAHGMTHADLTKIPLSKAEYEISKAPECIHYHIPQMNNHHNITIYANAFARGGDNKDLVNLVAKHYNFARTGYSNTTYLGCDGWYAEEMHEAPDCRPFNDNGTVKYEHRYQMHTSSHNELDKFYDHNTTKILDDFIRFLDHNIKFNDDGTIKALPIITYHNIAHLNETMPNWYNSTTLPETFAAEVKYMHDNDIRMLAMTDLVYDNATNKFHIKGG
jgi:hypothetical protein